MSIKKLAKAINNVADAIRYHADRAAESDIPKAEGFKVNDPEFLKGFDAGLEPAFSTPSESTITYKNPQVQNIPKYEGKETEHCLSEWASQALTEAEANYVDPYDQPVDFSDDIADENTQPVNAPGWQTLTVDDLDKKAAPPPPAPEAPAPEAPAPEAPAPEAPAPEAPAPEAPAAGAAELDSAGMPWDERIHSSGKSFLADGTWRLKRGVDDETMQAVTDELKKVMAIPAPPSAPEAPQGKITTLAQFAKACTENGIGAMMVAEAVKEAGLESTGQLGARPDLIPQVAEALQL